MEIMFCGAIKKKENAVFSINTMTHSKTSVISLKIFKITAPNPISTNLVIPLLIVWNVKILIIYLMVTVVKMSGNGIQQQKFAHKLSTQIYVHSMIMKYA